MTSEMHTPTVSRVGRYEVISRLGSGGMGTVYRARVSGPGKATKDVALKMLHPHLCRQQDFVEMFLHEVRLAMAMTHRNIVQTFDAGSEGRRHYMVMELVRGLSVRNLLKQLPPGQLLPLRLALFIGREVAAALQYAHGLDLELTGQHGGIVHRDVCPNNVLLSEQGEVKLTDFGIARAAVCLEADSQRTVAGKLKYMAPEQARGEAEPRSDLFSLGAVMVEMLCGRSLRASADVEQVRSGQVSHELIVQQPGLPADLARILVRLTAAELDERFASATELMRALDDRLQQVPLDPVHGADCHAALATFLKDRLGPEDTAGSDAPAARVARLLVDGAPTVADSHTHTAPTVGSPVRPISSPSHRRRRGLGVGPRGVWIAGVLVLLAAGAVGLGLAWSPDHAPVPGARAVRLAAADATAVPDPSPAPPDSAIATAPVDAGAVHPPRPSKRRGRSGRLFLNADPWATVYVDGRRVGNTPIQGLRLSPGLHRVRVVNPALKASRTLRLRVRPGQTLRRAVQLR